MREILFRGKRTDNGEWVYGVPIKDSHGETVMVESVYECEEYNCRGANCLYVNENTVEQYTGLTDKNGKLMYTGDIINALLDFGMPIKSVCAFRDDLFGLFAKQHGAEHFHPFTSLCNISYEIIGNIHDNKELFEVER